MAQFNAGTAVEAMEWDFTDFGGGKGVIPEPTSGHVEGFFRTIKHLALAMRQKQGALADDLDPEKMSDQDAAIALSEADEGVLSEFDQEMADALGALCQDNPSAAEIQKLPFRVRAAFSSWLIGQLRPEAPGPATKR